ncbi:hypothetical protein EJ03DRAFT_171122 [Teratosphaeria nubilosa]|uniref:Uncharacterized protein n=1 Tax=Teratosphaeria nubilosa TaxID=161662 RepID=A0A6G1LJR9_9PEZI|nr:hypothetical protein EJ03DRAFT_171122 [Teratosphaeria nubilosa]
MRSLGSRCSCRLSPSEGSNTTSSAARSHDGCDAVGVVGSSNRPSAILWGGMEYRRWYQNTALVLSQADLNCPDELQCSRWSVSAAGKTSGTSVGAMVTTRAVDRWSLQRTVQHVTISVRAAGAALHEVSRAQLSRGTFEGYELAAGPVFRSRPLSHRDSAQSRRQKSHPTATVHVVQ